MDIAQTQLLYQCPKHPDYQIDFLQIDNLSANEQGQQLFYCSSCAFKDPQFKISNYKLFKDIIKSKEDQILLNWPPVSNNQIIRQLIEISTDNEDYQSILAVIEKYFEDLKREIMSKIEISHKKMIKQVQTIALNKIDILNKYQVLSRVNELRTLLIEKQTDIHQKEQQYRILVENILAKKQAITEELTSLLNQHQQMSKIIFNSESALEMKQSILSSISSINLFQQTIIQNQNTQINPKQQQKLDVQLFTTDYDNGKDKTTINKNENKQYQLIQKQQSDDWLNTVSNIILQKKTKYIFRIQIQMINKDDNCLIGLMQNKNIHTQCGYKDYLSYELQYKDNQISQYPDYNEGIRKIMKGKELIWKEKEIEMRVCIKDQILEVLDYPSYTSKLVLQDEHKSKLINCKDLRLYLGTSDLNSSMILKEVFTVDKFE